MSAINNALVVGGGIAGLSVAIALRQQGIAVEVVEKYKANEVVGVGIILQGNAIRAIDRLGVLDEVLKEGFTYDATVFYNVNGEKIVIPEERIAGSDRPPAAGITRPAYSRILTDAACKAGATIHTETTVTALDQDPDGVDVVFSDGRTGRYDIVVGADGIHSPTRQHVFGDAVAPRYSGQAAWRVNFKRMVDQLEAYDSGDSGRAGLVPLSDERMYMFLTDSSKDLRPPEGDLREVLYEKLAPFGGLIKTLREQLPSSDDIVWKPFLLVDLPRPWYRGRVIIIGDAAHATTAHLAQGGAMAIEDAIVLGEELGRDTDVQSALDAIMDRRFPRANQIQQWSEALCQMELDRSTEGDHYSITVKARELIREPI